jgi:hypothetical protein
VQFQGGKPLAFDCLAIWRSASIPHTVSCIRRWSRLVCSTGFSMHMF